LKPPTKISAEVLKDGDFVEMDADNEIIKITRDNK
jgi:hypothetical protein